jgi:hypothetical protein
LTNKILLENSDDYVRAFLAHYELTKGGNAKSLKMDKYLSWLPYAWEEFKNEADRLEEKLDRLEKNVDKKMDEMDKKINGKIDEMKEIMGKILNNLEKE